MNRKIRFVALGAALVAVAAAGAAVGAIRNSKHDFSNSGNGGIWGSPDQTEVCVFCHTPHNAQAGLQPLWNRTLPNKPFTLYSSPTLNAQVNQPGGSSSLCLSCHDGSIAIDSFVNGGPNQPRMMALGDVYYPGSPFGEAGPNIGGNFTGNSNVNNLSNDHPVSFTYDDALVAADGQLASPAALPAALKLSAGKLECSTCHDVHNAVSVPGTKLLRLPIVGSQLCLTCHSK